MEKCEFRKKCLLVVVLVKRKLLAEGYASCRSAINQRIVAISAVVQCPWEGRKEVRVSEEGEKGKRRSAPRRIGHRDCTEQRDRQWIG